MIRILIVVLLVLVAWYLVQKRKTKVADVESDPEETKRLAIRKSTPYHAVSIEPGPYACAAANELRGEKFLSTEAPQLPLPDCTSSNCECRFTHYCDRRGRKDRRSELPRGFGTGETGKFEVDRRGLKDRRSDRLDDL